MKGGIKVHLTNLEMLLNEYVQKQQNIALYDNIEVVDTIKTALAYCTH